MQRLRDAIDLEKLETVIRERHSSRSGFISFYDNDIGSWLEKRLDEYDHNEMGTLLMAAMLPYTSDNRDFDYDLCQPIFENDYSYIDNHCDWTKFERLVTERREEKREKAAA